ncbi:nuclease A inhibitor family protein [Leptolyngbya iicbica]|uniref:Nuclease n=2 Tax=Cyanophyceae TaxID=3028117 RepID=A0A4Q7EGE0_9CYAN|nr:nuclease A inhibitor family protein [Leptolyngbya sp. LK]RZM82353.1 hypothetical protein DYY88_03655 [Leptolyngbya sp. LK]
MTDTALIAQLKQSIDGLWLPSETEAPWTVPTWELTTGETDELLRVLRRAADTPITEISLPALMAQIERRCRGYGEEGKAIAERHHALFDWLESVGDRWRVFRVGEVTVDVVVVGETAAGYVALQTQSVET